MSFDQTQQKVTALSVLNKYWPEPAELSRQKRILHLCAGKIVIYYRQFMIRIKYRAAISYTIMPDNPLFCRLR